MGLRPLGMTKFPVFHPKGEELVGQSKATRIFVLFLTFLSPKHACSGYTPRNEILDLPVKFC